MCPCSVGAPRSYGAWLNGHEHRSTQTLISNTFHWRNQSVLEIRLPLGLQREITGDGSGAPCGARK